ncbi:fibronectin type III domain-containing protein [bacterium]|nr:fibronectin type III domain-containing protein [bacterium]
MLAVFCRVRSPRIVVSLGILVALFTLGCCGGGNPPTAPQPAVESPLSMLPALDALPQLPPGESGLVRGTSLSGPGWQEIALDQPNFSTQSSQAVASAGGWKLEAASGMAWKIWALGNWPADTAPTGLNSLVSSVSCEYYLAFSDYYGGRWRMLGPFSSSQMVQYDPEDGFATPGRYVSPRGLHYVALLVPEGGSLQLDALEIGVHGGGSAPEMTMIGLSDGSSEQKVIIHWPNSPDYADADFMGYAVERRPASGGNWQRISGAPFRSAVYIDEESQPGVFNRYRVSATDSSGNTAYSSSLLVAALPGNDAAPVVMPVVPQGPLYGPVQVSLDLSGSYDPDGTPISGYSFFLNGADGPISTPDPVLDVTLQPGCYSLFFIATSNGKSSSTNAQLKVYPRWEEQPHTVTSGPHLIPRSPSFQPVANPDGSSTLLFYDVLQPGLSALTHRPDGTQEWDFLPLPGSGNGSLSEPVETDGGYSVMVYQPSRETLCYWDGEELSFVDFTSGFADSEFIGLAATNIGQLFYIYFNDTGVDFDLTLTRIKAGTTEVVRPGLAAATSADIEFDPASGGVDIVVSGGSAEWIRRMPDGSFNSAVVSPAPTSFVDLEHDPSTNRPAVILLQGSQYFYSALNADLQTWSALQIIDPSGTQTIGGDLIAADGRLYCQLTDSVSGVCRLFALESGNWSLVNEDDDFPCLGLQHLLRLPGSTGFRSYTMLSSWNIAIKDITTQDSQTALPGIPAASGHGLHMAAAASENELHVVEERFGKIWHYHSSDGENWTEGAFNPAGYFPRLCRDTAKHLFLSFHDGVDAQLQEWNGAAFAGLATLGASNDVIPLLSGERNYLIQVDDRGNVPAFLRSQRQGQLPIDTLLTNLPVWDGQPVLAGSTALSLVNYGGSSPDTGQLGIVGYGLSSVVHLADVPLSFTDDYFVESRWIDGGVQLGLPYFQDRPVWYVAYGPELRPIRVRMSLLSEPYIEDLPLSIQLFTHGDLRRTVSVMNTNGMSLVAFVSDNSGPERLLEWETFGEYESLPLPEGRIYSQGQLATGPDGRWHLFYRDLANDELKVLSTI